MKGFVGGPLLVGGLGPGPPAPLKFGPEQRFRRFCVSAIPIWRTDRQSRVIVNKATVDTRLRPTVATGESLSAYALFASPVPGAIMCKQT